MANKKDPPGKRLKLVNDEDEHNPQDDPQDNLQEEENERIIIRYRSSLSGQSMDKTMLYLKRVQNLYQRGNVLVEVLSDPPQRDEAFPVSEADLAHKITEYFKFVSIKATKEGFQEISVAPPKSIISAIHRKGRWPGVPYLRAITSHPVVRPDGSIRTEPGYDEEIGVYSTHNGDLGVKPYTQREAYEARKKLFELVDEFPFVDSDFDVWLGSVLTPLVRPWCGPSPMFIITSSTPGAGKTRLTKISSIISCNEEGIERGAIPPNNEEWQKCLISWALNCPEIICFDNVRSGSKIGSSVLDMALTEDKLSGRLLGQSKNINIELSATWIANGNNLTTAGDTSRRALICRIEPMMARPDKREFRIPNILAHTRMHRARYLSLSCGILAGWLASQGPAPLPLLGSFERWSHAVRGAILWAGGADIANALAAELEDSNDDERIHCDLMAQWHAELEGPITASKLLELCQNSSDLYYGKLADIVSEFCPGRGSERFGTVKMLSAALRARENRVRDVEIKDRMFRLAVKRVRKHSPAAWTIQVLE